MTTVAIDLVKGKAASDSFNSPEGGSPLLCQKMWKLENGDVFFESGHLRPIELALEWAADRWDPEERSEAWDELEKDPDKYAFACILVQNNGVVQYLDEEFAPIKVFDLRLTLGTGGAYARGVLDHGGTVEEAVEIAIRHDPNSGGPIQTIDLPISKAMSWMQGGARVL